MKNLKEKKNDKIWAVYKTTGKTFVGAVHKFEKRIIK